RRNTRLVSAWSPDVCSSDLDGARPRTSRDDRPLVGDVEVAGMRDLPVAVHGAEVALVIRRLEPGAPGKRIARTGHYPGTGTRDQSTGVPCRRAEAPAADPPAPGARAYRASWWRPYGRATLTRSAAAGC